MLESEAGIRPALTKWVSTKILNSVELYRLLLQVNGKQREQVIPRLDRLLPPSRATAQKAVSGYESVPGMFDFPKKVRIAILSQVSKIDSSFDFVTDVTEHLQKHWKSWGLEN
jgi:hypothetical protein